MSVTKSLRHLSASVVSVQQVEPMKQGIVTILGSDSERNYKGSSLRRTLSADMSSKKWLSQNGFFLPVKKIPSSEQVVIVPDHDSSSSESEEEFERSPAQEDVWRSIQSQKNVHKREETNVWGTLILTQKSENSASSNLLPPPYIHPLVKRSASAMSERSLKICTESLGSETGSDEFGSYPSSETLGNGDDDKEERERALQEAARIKAVDPFEDLHIVEYKNSPARPIPPPLSSISGGYGAPSLYMHAYRKDGRLVLEAVSVPPRKSFHAKREDGRLVLTSIDRLHSQANEAETRGPQEYEKVFDDMEEDGGSNEEKEVEDGGHDDDNEQAQEEMDETFELSMDQNERVQKPDPLMRKFMGLGIKNPKCCHEFNKSAKLIEEELTIPQSLPPRPPSVARLIPSPSPPPPVPAATTFNAYEYFWRNKINTPQATALKNYKLSGANQEMEVKKGNKIECFVPYLRGCNKEPRRSLAIWEPYYIATS